MGRHDLCQGFDRSTWQFNMNQFRCSILGYNVNFNDCISCKHFKSIYKERTNSRRHTTIKKPAIFRIVKDKPFNMEDYADKLVESGFAKKVKKK